MMRPRVLALVPAFLNPPKTTVDSLLKQNGVELNIAIVVASPLALVGIPDQVSKLVVRPDMNLTVGERVAKALNQYLKSLNNLEYYDYILKIDDDTVLPPDFLSVNINAGYDLLGGGALLIKTKPFLRIMRGKFLEICADDLYLMLSFSAIELKTLPMKYILQPILTRSFNPSQRRQYIW